MKRILTLFLVIFASCATATRIGMGVVGGVAGSLAGPGGTAAGVAAGVAGADLLLHEEEIESQAETIQEQAQTIQALTRGDVEGIVGEKGKSWADGVISEIMGVLKLVGLLAAISIGGILLYIAHRKKAAKKYYDVIDKWIEEEEDERQSK